MNDKNPWLTLALDHHRANFILKEERSIIAKFNAEVSDTYKIRTSIFPAPFMGDVHNASVFILMLNPGYDPKEAKNGYYKAYEDWWLQQIQHILPKPKLPLFCLDDDYLQKSPYWANKLKPLTAVAGKEAVSRQVAKVQFFPYHSQKYKPLFKRLLKEEGFDSYLPSQEYNFSLVRKAMDRKALILIPRSRRYWFKAIPELRNYPNLHFTNSYGNIIFSKNNLGERSFNQIAKKISN